MAEITIKVGNITIEAGRDDVMEVNETPDGIAFFFKGGLHVVYTDPYMVSAIKQTIKNTADYVKGQRLIFKLDNRKQPVLVQAD